MFRSLLILLALVAPGFAAVAAPPNLDPMHDTCNDTDTGQPDAPVVAINNDCDDYACSEAEAPPPALVAASCNDCDGVPNLDAIDARAYKPSMLNVLVLEDDPARTWFKSGLVPDGRVDVLANPHEFVEAALSGDHDLLSFDHDLGFYDCALQTSSSGLVVSLPKEDAEVTGWHAATAIASRWPENKPRPKCIVHSINDSGSRRICQALIAGGFRVQRVPYTQMVGKVTLT